MKPSIRHRSASRPHLFSTSVSLALVAALSLTGCSTEPPETPSTASASTAPRVAVSLPATVVGVQAQWVLDTMNSEQDVIPEQVASRFSQSLLDQAPAEDLAAILNGLRAQRKWIPTIVQETAESQLVVTMYGSSGPGVDLNLAIDEAGLIHGIFFGPASGERTPATSWDELKDSFEKFPFEASISVTQTDGKQKSLFDVNGDRTLPIGSTFKLYVLGAVADAVAAGTLTWDEQLTVTEDVKSIPSGELQDVPDGTQVSIRDAATKMISISDNTATDMLIARVGRAAVEKALKDMGHHDPARNTPFLTTREMTQLGWSGGTKLREEWKAGDEAERASILEALPGGALNVPLDNITDAVWQYGLDWFANSDDLVAAHTYLQKLAKTDAGEPLRAILTMNPGAGMKMGDAWSYIAFKGGSGPGEISGSWFLEGTDGASYVITIQGAAEDPATLGVPAVFFGSVEDAAALLSAGKKP